MHTVVNLVRYYLVLHGFDGLYSPDGECGCLVGDLAPCGDIGGECVAGYKRACPAYCGDPYWLVGPERP